jgi:hypothetical protein
MKKSYSLVNTPNKLGELLGLSDSDIALMKYKADLTSLAIKKIKTLFFR